MWRDRQSALLGRALVRELDEFDDLRRLLPLDGLLRAVADDSCDVLE